MSERTIPPELPDYPGSNTPAPPVTPVPPPPPEASYQPADAAAPAPDGGASGSSNLLLGRLAVGVGVILLGLLSLFPGIIRYVANGEIWRFWPLILVGLGAVQMARAEDAKARHGAAWLLVSGAVLLIHFLPFGLSWADGWPLWIVGAGLVDLTFPEKARDRGIGVFLLALGAVLLGWRLDSIPEGWENAWPLLVVLFGIVLVWQALFTEPGNCSRSGRRRRRRSSESDYRRSEYHHEENRHG
jgi:hypothetical protein